MKYKKKLEKLAARQKDYETTLDRVSRSGGNVKAYKKPGAIK